jgi:hypothetical protein
MATTSMEVRKASMACRSYRADVAAVRILGIDFTSAPRRAKPITVAHGHLRGSVLKIDAIENIETFTAFEDVLRRRGPWIGGFDFPFGLPREAVEGLGWPTNWRKLTQHCFNLGKPEFKRQLDRYRESRDYGNRYATRRGDKVSHAHPAVKLVNPPVGLMFFEGAPRLAAAKLTIPCLSAGDPARVALEAYPGFLVRSGLGIKDSYKNDQRGKQTTAHEETRQRIVRALKAGAPHGIHAHLNPKFEHQVVADGSGDQLDAVICAIQASWGQTQGAPRYGLPPNVDPVEGWIVTAR